MSFSFGTPSSAPATTGLAGGFSFGANKPATTGFGLTATSQPSTGLFGAPATTTAPAFGTPFGSTSFGATTTPAFGTSAAAPTFGTTTPAFGAATSTLSFGTTPATSLPSLSSSFGATTTPSFGLGTSGLNFGAGTSTAASTGLSFGAPATTTTPSLGGLGGLGFGTSTAQTSSFSLFPSTSTATSSLFAPKLGATSVTGTLPSTSVTPSLGLGGAAYSTSGFGAANSTDAKNEQPKQQKLPNEILTTVESFKEFVKKQKGLSSEVMRVSVKPLQTVSREAECTLRAALSLKGSVVRTRAAAKLQRHAALAAVVAADAAARDHAHPGTELEGSAPPTYVKELIAELEQKLIAFRSHMDSADKQMQSSPKLLTEQELNMGFRRMHESLVALAGRLQTVHTQVQAQKEQYLNLRKYILKDPTDVFDTPTPSSSLDQLLNDLDGGRKKMRTDGVESLGGSILGDTRTSMGQVNLVGPSPFVYSGGLSPYPLVDNNAPTWQPQTTPTAAINTVHNTFGSATDSSVGFQLQKPPGKRGKQ